MESKVVLLDETMRAAVGRYLVGEKHAEEVAAVLPCGCGNGPTFAHAIYQTGSLGHMPPVNIRQAVQAFLVREHGDDREVTHVEWDVKAGWRATLSRPAKTAPPVGAPAPNTIPALRTLDVAAKQLGALAGWARKHNLGGVYVLETAGVTLAAVDLMVRRWADAAGNATPTTPAARAEAGCSICNGQNCDKPSGKH